MKISELEKDVISEMAQDAHELWERFSLIRYNHPKLSEEQIIRCGHDLLIKWLERGWLEAYQSREDMTRLSAEEIQIFVNTLGSEASDPEKATILLDLTNRAVTEAKLPEIFLR